MFGEVSLLYGCPRTATVESKQYCECAFLNNEQFSNLISAHPVLKSYLVMNVRNNYDDGLRTFLITCLKEIDYLGGDFKEEILIHMSLNMIVNAADKNSFIFNPNDAF